MTTYYSTSDTSFNLAMNHLKQDNQCYDSIANTLFSNPKYYTIDSCNNLLLTSEGNTLFQQLMQQTPDCSGANISNTSSTTNVNDMIQQYQRMSRRRKEIDDNMNMTLNMNSRSNLEPTLYQQSNQDVSVSIMFIVLGISMFYYMVRHLNES